MKVGLIGLGRMGEGMSRRMMRQGIEVWGYRRNYEKAQELYEDGGIDGVTVDIAGLCSTVKQSGPGIFMIIAGEQKGLLSWVSNILTVALLVVFMVWTVDIVLWLVVQIQQYPSVLQSSMHSPPVLDLHHAQGRVVT